MVGGASWQASIGVGIGVGLGVGNGVGIGVGENVGSGGLQSSSLKPARDAKQKFMYQQLFLPQSTGSKTCAQYPPISASGHSSSVLGVGEGVGCKAWHSISANPANCAEHKFGYQQLCAPHSTGSNILGQTPSPILGHAT